MAYKIQNSEHLTVGHHGTSHDSACIILQENFKLPPPDTESYLGLGVYFFENQLGNAKRWAFRYHGQSRGSTVAVIQSKIKCGRMLDLTERDVYETVTWFAREFERKARQRATLATVIDIAAAQLGAEVVRAVRVRSNAVYLLGTGFSTDIEIILAVRELKNILSTEMIWSEMRV